MSLYPKKPWDFSFVNFMSRANLWAGSKHIYMKWESGPVEMYPWFMSTVQLWNDSGITYDLPRCLQTLKNTWDFQSGCSLKLSSSKPDHIYIIEMGKWPGRDVRTDVVLSVQLWNDSRINVRFVTVTIFWVRILEIISWCHGLSLLGLDHRNSSFLLLLLLFRFHWRC